MIKKIKLAATLSELLKLGFPLNWKDKRGNNLLHLLVYANNFNLVVENFRHFPPDLLEEKNQRGETPAALASRLSHYRLYWLLVERRPALFSQVDYIAEFYRILGKEKMNSTMVANIVNLDTRELIFRKKIPHTESSGFAPFNLISQAHQLDLKVEAKKIPINPWLELLGQIYFLFKFFLTKGASKYPWKNFTNQPNTNLEIDYLLFSQEETKAIKNFVREKKVNILAHLMNELDKIFQEEFLTKKVNKTQWLIVNTQHTLKEPYAKSYNDISFSPIKVNSTTDLEARKLTSRIKRLKHSLSYLQVAWETFFFVRIYHSPLRPLLKPFLSGELSRFAVLSFFGGLKSEKEITIVGKTLSNAFSKLNVTIGFHNERLMLCVDVHPSLLKNTSKKEINDKIRGALVASFKAQP